MSATNDTPQRPLVPGGPGVIMPLSTGPTNLLALPATVNLTLYQGDDFTFRLAVYDAARQPADLDGATVRAQIRETAASEQVAGEFQPTIAASIINLHLTSAISAGLPARCVWDCEITIEGRVTTIAAGTIDQIAEVSR